MQGGRKGCRYVDETTSLAPQIMLIGVIPDHLKRKTVSFQFREMEFSHGFTYGINTTTPLLWFDIFWYCQDYGFNLHLKHIK
jgi:hypothetical protein